jgi:hypothetical protein
MASAPDRGPGRNSPGRFTRIRGRRSIFIWSPNRGESVSAQPLIPSWECGTDWSMRAGSTKFRSVRGRIRVILSGILFIIMRIIIGGLLSGVMRGIMRRSERRCGAFSISGHVSSAAAGSLGDAAESTIEKSQTVWTSRRRSSERVVRHKQESDTRVRHK